MKTLAEKIAVMQAAERGKQIQHKNQNTDWFDSHSPHWDWGYNDYRVKPLDPLRKLSVEEAEKAPSVYVVDFVSETGVSEWSGKGTKQMIARRGEAYATREGALAEAKRRWGNSL